MGFCQFDLLLLRFFVCADVVTFTFVLVYVFKVCLRFVVCGMFVDFYFRFDGFIVCMGYGCLNWLFISFSLVVCVTLEFCFTVLV